MFLCLIDYRFKKKLCFQIFNFLTFFFKEMSTSSKPTAVSRKQTRPPPAAAVVDDNDDQPPALEEPVAKKPKKTTFAAAQTVKSPKKAAVPPPAAARRSATEGLRAPPRPPPIVETEEERKADEDAMQAATTTASSSSSYLPDQTDEDDAKLAAEVAEQEANGFVAPEPEKTPAELEAERLAQEQREIDAFEASFRADPALKQIIGQFDYFFQRFNTRDPPLVDVDGNSRLRVTVNLSKKNNQVYLNVTYAGRQIRLPGLPDSDVRNSFMMMTPVARMTEGNEFLKWYPAGNLGTEFCADAERNPKISFELSDRPLLDSMSYKNKAFSAFHKKALEARAEILRQIKIKERDVWNKGYATFEESNLKKLDAARKEKKKGDPRTYGKTPDSQVPLTDEEKLAVGWESAEQLAESFWEYQKQYIVMRGDFGSDGSRVITFAANMLKPASDEERARILDDNWKSWTGDEVMTLRIRQLAAISLSDENDPKVVEKKKAKAEKMFPFYRLLTPAEHATNPEQEELKLMTAEEILTTRPGDWISTLCVWSWTNMDDKYYLKLSPVAIIWVGHHPELSAAASAFIDPKDLEEEKKIPRVTFGFAQIPSLMTANAQNLLPAPAPQRPKPPQMLIEQVEEGQEEEEERKEEID
jgi:hypothetical protein